MDTDLKPTVSVVIPTYNYGRFIAAAVESALGQTYPVGEVMIVDDGSADETEQIVRGLSDPRVRYLRQANAGVSAARNKGVASTSGELIAFLDADDAWHPAKIERQVDAYLSEVHVGLVSCGMRKFDGDTDATIELLDSVVEQPAWRNLLLWERPAVCVSGSAIIVSREAFDAVGGFDEAIKVGEDWDLCYGVARKFNVVAVNEPLVDYRYHRHNAHANVTEMENGMTRFYEKAFAVDDAEVRSLRSRAMGNYHAVLAGSYYRSNSFAGTVKHVALGLFRSRGRLLVGQRD